MFSEALSVFHEVFPAITSKKRSRAEGFSNDRSNAMLSDRPVLGPSMGKVGVQGHPVTGGFELDQQKSEERTKNAVPNKRTRTSMLDGRVCVFDVCSPCLCASVNMLSFTLLILPIIAFSFSHCFKI